MMPIDAFAKELRKWWSFDDRQMHTHSWHSREDFIEKMLPVLLAPLRFSKDYSSSIGESPAASALSSSHAGCHPPATDPDTSQGQEVEALHAALSSHERKATP